MKSPITPSQDDNELFKEVQISVRLPVYLKRLIEDSVAGTNLSQNTEIIKRLKETFVASDTGYTEALEKIEKLVTTHASNPYSQQLSQRLKKALKLYNILAKRLEPKSVDITPSIVAEQLGYKTAREVSAYFSGIATPTFEEVRLMALKLGVNPDYLAHGMPYIAYPVETSIDLYNFKQLVAKLLGPQEVTGSNVAKIKSLYLCRMLNGNMTLNDILRQIQNKTIDAYDFEKLNYALLPYSDTYINPLDVDLSNRQPNLVSFHRLSKTLTNILIPVGNTDYNLAYEVNKAIKYLIKEVFNYVSDKSEKGVPTLISFDDEEELLKVADTYLDNSHNKSQVSAYALFDELTAVLVNYQYGSKEYKELASAINCARNKAMPNLRDLIAVVRTPSFNEKYSNRIDTGETVAKYISRRVFEVIEELPRLARNTNIAPSAVLKLALDLPHIFNGEVKEQLDRIKLTDNILFDEVVVRLKPNLLIVKNYSNNTSEAFELPILLGENINDADNSNSLLAQLTLVLTALSQLNEISLVQTYDLPPSQYNAVYQGDLPTPLLITKQYSGQPWHLAIANDESYEQTGKKQWYDNLDIQIPKNLKSYVTSLDKRRTGFNEQAILDIVRDYIS